MLDYKNIITKHFALGMSGAQIAESLGVSKSGVNDFLRAFKACKTLSYPLPHGITYYGIAAHLEGAFVSVKRAKKYGPPTAGPTKKESSI
jgi:hypothetical protein